MTPKNNVKMVEIQNKNDLSYYFTINLIYTLCSNCMTNYYSKIFALSFLDTTGWLKYTKLKIVIFLLLLSVFSKSSLPIFISVFYIAFVQLLGKQNSHSLRRMTFYNSFSFGLKLQRKKLQISQTTNIPKNYLKEYFYKVKIL